jgi:hypothetical protein
MLNSVERDRLVMLARQRLAAGVGHDDVLGELRRLGLDKGDSMIVFCGATDLSAGDVKRLVHHSETWSDRVAGDEQLEEKADVLDEYRRCLDRQRFGQAFTALVAAAQDDGLPDYQWPALAEAAETLCLTELLTDTEPGPDADDYVHAAWKVRSRSNVS